MKKIAIIGAGISGLFAANLFSKNSDYQVMIYEKNNSIELDEGYGIQLSTNSIKLLNNIGFNKLEDIDQFNPEQIDFYDLKNQKKICELNISKFNTENCKYTALKRSKPRIPFGSLVELGIIKPGTNIFDNKKKITARIMADGSIKHNQAEGSIHKVAATILGAESCNGWTYWHCNINGRTYPIDYLRQRLISKN